MERVNYDSVARGLRRRHGARRTSTCADDLIYLGPFEDDVHVDNPAPGPLRARVVVPGQPLRARAGVHRLRHSTPTTSRGSTTRYLSRPPLVGLAPRR